MNRRDFCVGGAVLGCAAGGMSAAVDGVSSRSFHKVIFDTRFAASRLWAAAFRGPLGERAGVAGDINRLWYDGLAQHWSTDRIVLTGMTTPATLFCLEQLAKDHWRRVVLRIEHCETGQRQVSHRITADGPNVDRAAQHFDRTPAWPRAAAAAVASFEPIARAAPTKRTLRSSSWALPSAQGNLISWIIA